MFSSLYYTLRSTVSGHYLVARPQPNDPAGYLLVFREHADALSYLNTHGPDPDMDNRFAVESIPEKALKSILQRWKLGGVGIVQDPLLPEIEFFNVER